MALPDAQEARIKGLVERNDPDYGTGKGAWHKLLQALWHDREEKRRLIEGFEANLRGAEETIRLQKDLIEGAQHEPVLYLSIREVDRGWLNGFKEWFGDGTWIEPAIAARLRAILHALDVVIAQERAGSRVVQTAGIEAERALDGPVDGAVEFLRQTTGWSVGVRPRAFIRFNDATSEPIEHDPEAILVIARLLGWRED